MVENPNKKVAFSQKNKDERRIQSTEEGKEELVNEPREVLEEYEPLMEEVTEEEWGEALEQTKSKLALAVSGITYPMIKKANGYAKEIFRYLASRCLKEESMPRKWKLGTID
ncbi:12585_t:CDS:2 [Gigaspora margarita]|uniref:12585_t:CDS:1 n=1 Tax=Gigaspora margarita TaxID=4874 RepID=A0ABN7VBI3_GIGMA|nr:12585_t:CDS:2 [Gigaspora margarita]